MGHRHAEPSKSRPDSGIRNDSESVGTAHMHRGFRQEKWRTSHVVRHAVERSDRSLRPGCS